MATEKGDTSYGKEELAESTQQTCADLRLDHNASPARDGATMIDVTSWPVKSNAYQPGQTTVPIDEAEILPNQKEQY